MAEAWRVSQLDVDIEYEDEIPVIVARGECDLVTSRKLRDAVDDLIKAGHCKIVFDMRDMTYIDSSGFRVLLETKNKVAELNGDIALVSLTAPVERVFNLLRLGELILRTDSVGEAIEKLRSIQCRSHGEAAKTSQDLS